MPSRNHEVPVFSGPLRWLLGLDPLNMRRERKKMGTETELWRFFTHWLEAVGAPTKLLDPLGEDLGHKNGP